jgi:type II secretory pathway predicted ATPase ExeA/septal ring-binding cell division protein DamX
MYYSHFGFTEPPFRITPNTEFFYSGGNRGPILDALIYAIGQGEGIIKVTGEVGSGKTMLCNMLLARLPAHVETIYLANPSVSPEEILRAIAVELQLPLPPGADRVATMQALNRHLVERHAQHKQVVMFVEESQSMPLATLEEIRLLSNLETRDHKLLQIVLFGQPELEDNLRQPQIRQLRERITHSFRLSPLQLNEIGDYLNFRLRAAGYRGPDLFSAPVISAIAKASGGLNRRINLIADKALLAAFSENTHSVKLKHIKAAIRDSEFSQPAASPSWLRAVLVLLLLAVGAGAGIAIYAGLQNSRPKNSASAAAPSAKTPAPVAVTPPPEATTAPPDLPTADSTTTATAAQVAVAPSTIAAPAPTAAPAAASAAPPAVSIDSAKATPPAPAVAPALPTDKIKKIINKEGVNKIAVPAATDGDVLTARLAATEIWLAQRPENTFSIQLLGAESPQQLKNHLKVIRKYVEINDIFVYRTLAKQKPWLTVLYGTFDDRRTALAALAQLPAPLKAYQPYLRTVQGIRSEIALHQP